MRSAAKEILERKSRGGTQFGRISLSHIRALQHMWEKHSNTSEDFSDLIPIKMVTLLEVFVRDAIRDIVDSGQTYIERAEKLSKGARIDLLFAAHLQGQRLSIGDLVSHTISVNNVSSIISSFDALIPNFTDQLKQSHEKWSEEAVNWPLPPLVKNYDTLIKSLYRLFEVRHIVTHEIPLKRVYAHTEIGDFLEAGATFIEATDWVIISALHGSVPRTQLSMNEDTANQRAALEVEMESIFNTLLGRGELSPDALADNHRLWMEFAESEANLHASLVEGGSMMPMVWNSAKAEAIRDRIKKLRWWLDREEGET